MKKDIVVIVKESNLVYEQIYTWSDYSTQEEAFRALLMKGFTFDVKKQIFIKEKENQRVIAKIVDLTF